MAYSKIKILILMHLFLCSYLFGDELIEVSAKLKQITHNKILFVVSIQNNSDKTVYLYPKGAKGYSHVLDNVLFIVPNNDEDYQNGFAAAHYPLLDGIDCIKIKSKRRIKYKYNITKNPNINGNFYEVDKILFSLCVLDKDLKEMNTFNDYLDNVKNNLLSKMYYEVK